MSKDGTRAEFMEKFMEAKRLEKEAFMLLVPDRVRGHLEVIKKEAGEMFMECMIDLFAQEKAGKRELEEEKEEGKIKKVTID